MRLISVLSTIIVTLASAPAVLAASVAPQNGEVFIYQDSGFVSIFSPTQVAAGTTVMVPAGRAATIAFGNDCGTTVHGPATFRVPAVKGTDCPAYLFDTHAGHQPPSSLPSAGHGLGSVGSAGPFVIGGLVVAGGVAAAVALSNGDDKKSPASP